MLSRDQQLNKQKLPKKRKKIDTWAKKLKIAQIAMEKSLKKIKTFRPKDFKNITGIKHPS